MAGVVTRKTNYNPIVSYSNLDAQRESYRMSKTEQDFNKKGYAAHTPIRAKDKIESKVGGRGTNAPKISEDLEREYNKGRWWKNSKPLPDKLCILKTSEVKDDTINTNNLQRLLAKEGHHLVRAQYNHDVITNERTGKGTLHVRADDKQELNRIKNKIREQGLQVELIDQYRPVWKN